MRIACSRGKWKGRQKLLDAEISHVLSASGSSLASILLAVTLTWIWTPLSPWDFFLISKLARLFPQCMPFILRRRSKANWLVSSWCSVLGSLQQLASSRPVEIIYFFQAVAILGMQGLVAMLVWVFWDAVLQEIYWVIRGARDLF